MHPAPGLPSQRRRSRRWPGLCGLALALTPACTEPEIRSSVPLDTLTPAEILAGCCDDSGGYPDWVMELAEANSGLLRDVAMLQLRPGRLAQHPVALAMVERTLQPLDVVVLEYRNSVSGHLLSGQFTHAAVYLGTEEQLRDAGLWSLPALRPWQGEITDGRFYLEGMYPAVRLAPAGSILDVDGVVILRPQAPRRAQALTNGMALVGAEFDMQFDAADPCRVFCAEVIDRMFPDAGLPRARILDRETIVIDAIVAGALTEELPFDIVGYVTATPGGGARVVSARDLAWDIRLRWPDRPPRD